MNFTKSIAKLIEIKTIKPFITQNFEDPSFLKLVENRMTMKVVKKPPSTFQQIQVRDEEPKWFPRFLKASKDYSFFIDFSHSTLDLFCITP